MVSASITFSSSAAIAVTIFIIDPGGEEARNALSRNGLDLSLLNWFQSFVEIGLENRLGSKDGLLIRAKISPVLISWTIAAPFSLPNESKINFSNSMSIVRLRVFPF